MLCSRNFAFATAKTERKKKCGFYSNRDEIDPPLPHMPMFENLLQLRRKKYTLDYFLYRNASSALGNNN